MFRVTLLILVARVFARPPYEVDITVQFCENRQPGLFAQGCSSNVTVCNKFGNEIYLLCPYELVFDQSVEECREYSMVDKCVSATDAPQTVPPEIVTLDSRPGPPVHLCEDKSEDFHSVTQCSNSVVLCKNGAPRLLECPNGEVFDNKKHKCVSPKDVPECAESQDEPESTNNSQSCEDRSDGFFEKEPCSSFYLSCAGGVSRVMNCPANLVFDKKLLICEYPGNVDSCNSVEHDDSSENGTEITCAEDGFFSYGNCSDMFYACSGGRMIPMYCPAKLAFDESRQLCDYPGAVLECNEEATEKRNDTATPKTEPNDSSVKESWDSNTRSDNFHNKEDDEVSKFCKSKKDGFYSISCSSEAIACEGGKGTLMLCPPHLVYHQTKQICEYPSNVPCNPEQTKQDETEAETCEHEGLSEVGRCNQEFINCIDGKVYRLHCAEDFVFSIAEGGCIDSSKVDECKSNLLRESNALHS